MQNLEELISEVEGTMVVSRDWGEQGVGRARDQLTSGFRGTVSSN
jgi:hypothetical protein